ncbi:MAG TPA: hypothetical protein VFK39_02660 [Gemmatimonadaceae bacterium]|nr:hypothetical protein [Gemmatimonadaceae bacterium]
MPTKRTASAGDTQSGGMGATSASDRTRSDARSGSVMDEAKDKAHELADKAQDRATQKVEAGVSKGRNRAADALGAVAQSLLYSSQQLRDQDRGTVGGFVEKAANRVENWADYVQHTDARQMADRVENFARREPAIFLGGAFALGLLGARFLKSSRRGDENQWDRSHYPTSQRARNERLSRTRGALSDREVPISRTPY